MRREPADVCHVVQSRPCISLPGIRAWVDTDMRDIIGSKIMDNVSDTIWWLSTDYKLQICPSIDSQDAYVAIGQLGSYQWTLGQLGVSVGKLGMAYFISVWRSSWCGRG